MQKEEDKKEQNVGNRYQVGTSKIENKIIHVTFILKLIFVFQM